MTTSTTDAPTAPRTAADGSAALVTTGARRPTPGRGRRVRAWWSARPARWDWRSGALLMVLLSGSMVLQAWGMDRSPQRIDDEGTYVAQAYAVLHYGQLSHYTFWYDHPPLGWIQLAGFFAVTRVLDHTPDAVAAGRVAMLAAQAVSMVLLWVLARRLDLPRWASALAVLVFSASPLALQFHRTVYLDNIATPWVLATFVLLCTPRRTLLAFTSAGATFAVAVLTKETSLLMAPAVAWLLWRRSAVGGTRRYSVAVSTTVFTLSVGAYALFAAIKGEVLPGAGHTSLVTGITYQLGGRASSGSVWHAGSPAHRTVATWLTLDDVTPVLTVLAAAAGLGVRRARPFAVTVLLLLAMLVRPGGYLPVPLIITVLPLGALLIALLADTAVRLARARATSSARRAALAAGLALAAVASSAAAAVSWPAPWRGLLIAPLDTPVAQAESYIGTQVPRADRVLVDDSLWLDLVRSGRPRADVVWYYKPDTDPAVPSGWQHYQWIVVTQSIRADPTASATVRGALAHSAVVASFGTGARAVQVRRLAATPTATAGAGDAQQRRARAAAGGELASSTTLTTSPAAAAALRAGDVDARLMTDLAALAAPASPWGHLALTALPAVPGEADAGILARRARLRVASPQDAAALARALSDQREEYAPQQVHIAGTTVTATFPLPAPAPAP